MTDITERKEPIWDIDQETVNSMADHLKVAEHLGAVNASCISLVEGFDFRGWVCFRTPQEAERCFDYLSKHSTQHIARENTYVIFNP